MLVFLARLSGINSCSARLFPLHNTVHSASMSSMVVCFHGGWIATLFPGEVFGVSTWRAWRSSKKTLEQDINGEGSVCYWRRKPYFSSAPFQSTRYAPAFSQTEIMLIPYCLVYPVFINFTPLQLQSLKWMVLFKLTLKVYPIDWIFLRSI